MLCPDYVPDAEMLRAEPERDAFVIGQRVLKRTEIPDDMLGALVFLAGPGSDFVTGQSLLVNGGGGFNLRLRLKLDRAGRVRGNDRGWKREKPPLCLYPATA